MPKCLWFSEEESNGDPLERGQSFWRLTSSLRTPTSDFRYICNWCPTPKVQRLFILSTFHFLIFSPCIINKQGTGIIASAKKASNEFPQPSPKALYIFGPASGRTAAMTDLVSVLAASAEAA